MLLSINGEMSGQVFREPPVDTINVVDVDPLPAVINNNDVNNILTVNNWFNFREQDQGKKISSWKTTGRGVALTLPT